MAAQGDDQVKRNGIGVYEKAGLSHYTEAVPGVDYGTGSNFPANWEPRFAMAAGPGAAPDRREDFRARRVGPRDAPGGFVVNGTLPPAEPQGVHSLTDVPVYALGTCQETFGGTYNIDVFHKMAACLGLARENVHDPGRETKARAGGAD